MRSPVFTTSALLVIAAIGLPVGLAACTLPGAPSVPGISGEDSKSADQILNDAVDGLRGAKTLHITVKTTAEGLGDVTFDLSVDEKGDVTGGGTVGGAK